MIILYYILHRNTHFGHVCLLLPTQSHPHPFLKAFTKSLRKTSLSIFPRTEVYRESFFVVVVLFFVLFCFLYSLDCSGTCSGWPQTQRDLPASASKVLGFKACAFTAWQSQRFCFHTPDLNVKLNLNDNIIQIIVSVLLGDFAG